MKITFDNQSINQTEKKEYTYKSESKASARSVSKAYGIEKTVGQNNTYEGSSMSVKEFKDTLKVSDVDVTQDYMTLMSHTVSSEDYGKMMEEGIDFSNVDTAESVTIVDRIKMYVAKGGTEVAGYTDTLSEETIEAMTGSKKLTVPMDVSSFDVTLDEEIQSEVLLAYGEINEVSNLTDGMKKYILSQNKDITIHNMYLAKHSALFDSANQGSDYFNVEAKGYLVKKAGEEFDNDISKEVTKLLENLGIAISEEAVNEGIWLVKNSIMVTPGNLEKLNKLDSISFPVTDEAFSKIVLTAISEGKKPLDADLNKDKPLYEFAIEITDEIINKVTDLDTTEIIEKINEIVSSDIIKEVLSDEALSRTRIMEETRLKMTFEANLMLLKSNVSIDTKDLEAYVDRLKEIENSNAFKEAKAVTEVAEIIDEVKALPAAFLPSLAPVMDTITLPEIINKGISTKVSFEEATKSYEMLGTNVRKDFGDSIKKAFRNVDDILEEMDIPVTSENRRAVRILGYNSMPITKESIDEIKEADAKLQSVLKRLSPQDTLKLIREGNSPVKMSISELNEYLDNKSDDVKEEIEKYSKFLFKLERNNEISDEERKAFIEVYRLFHQIEKGENAAIGSVLNAGQELTLGNLKTAVKTAKNRGLDIKIDASFGELVSDIRDNLTPERIVKTEFSDETTLDALYKRLEEVEVNAKDELDTNWNAEKMTEAKEALKAPEEVVSELVMNKISVTCENLQAAFSLMKNRGKAFKKLEEISDRNDFSEDEDSLIDALTSKEATKKAYDELIVNAKEKVLESAMMQDKYVDVRELKLTNLELSLAKNYSESETYEIPVTIGGEVTSVNLKIVHNLKESPNVLVVMETENLGRISARLSVKNDVVNGYISCNLEETVTKMQEVADKLSNEVLVVFSNKSDTDNLISKIPMRENSSEVSTTQLYGTAQKFLEAVKGIN